MLSQFKKYSTITMVIYVLLGLGLFRTLLFRPSSILIPAIVIAIVFYLFKNPQILQRFKHKSNRSYRQTNHTRKQNKKTHSFKVIKGSKDEQEEDYPKFH